MKQKLSTATSGWLYAFIHFSVEVCSFYFLYSRLSLTAAWVLYAFLFDAIAFIPQSFLGLWADTLGREYLGVAGCLMMLFGLFFPIDGLALVILTLGNAMIHISGAKHTLSGAEGKISPCSAFVAGGSFGVITGQLLGITNATYVWIPTVCMIFSLVLCIYIAQHHETPKDTFCSFHISSTTIHIGGVVFLAFLSTAIRSYVAYAIPTAWKKDTIHAILLFSFMGIGKYMGGFLCDRIGYQKTTTISLFLSLPFLLFGNQIMFISLIGVGLFSMTMPITVAILASAFPKEPAFAFGITTVALFVGVAPVFFFRPHSLWANQIIVLIFGILAAISLKTAMKRRC